MTVLWIWLRRGLGLRVALLLVAVLAAATWTGGDGWQYEWLWGARSVVGALPVVCALVAGGVAYDVVSYWEPLAAELGPSSRRWRRATLALAGSHALWALGGFALVLSAASVRLAANGALGRPDPWLPFEVAAALAAASSAGLLAGMRLRSLVAPPLVAALVFILPALSLPFGLDVLFTPTALSSTAIGVTRDPAAAITTVALNLAFASAFCALALPGARPTARWAATAAGTAAAVLALTAVAGSATAMPYRSGAAGTLCLTSGHVEVCGTRPAEPFLADLASGLDDAGRELSGSGLDLPRSWTLFVPGTQPPPSQATAVASPAGLSERRRTSTLADVLSQPRPCPQLFTASEETTYLLDLQQEVRTWIGDALRRGRSGPAPASVLSAYDQLTRCRPTP